MKFKNINRKMFKEVADTFVEGLGPEVTLHIFRKYVIGAVIDSCHHNGKVVVLNGDVYTVEHNERTGDLWNALYDIKAESVGEWIARVELALLP